MIETFLWTMYILKNTILLNQFKQNHRFIDLRKNSIIGY